MVRCPQFRLSSFLITQFLKIIFRVERSTDQVVKAINLEALSKWVGNIPQDVVDDMPKLAPMLRVLGYDPKANPPNYEEADLKINQKFLEKFPGRNRRRKEMVDVEDYLN